MNGPIVVVGSANMDLVCTAKRIPSPGETIWGDRFETFHGGKGANQAMAAARLGSDVRMVAKVGGDDFGRQLREGLSSASVNVEAVTTASDVASGVALISVDARGQNSIIVIPGANAELRPEDIDQCLAQIESAAILLVQLEIPMETVAYVCKRAHQAGVPVVLDPAPACPIPEEVLRCVTYLTPNETEAALLCGWTCSELDPEKAAQAAEMLLKTGPANVIVKMGERGAYLASANGVRTMIPAFKVHVVDSTAAGDAFNGGVATALRRGVALEEAIRYGTAVAAVSVQRAGAQTAMPTEQEVAALLERAAETVEVPEETHGLVSR